MSHYAHYNAQQITEVAKAHLARLADYYSTSDLPVSFDAPIVHAGSLMMASYIHYRGRQGMIQVPITPGAFDPQVFEHAISDRVEQVFQMLAREEAS